MNGNQSRKSRNVLSTHLLTERCKAVVKESRVWPHDGCEVNPRVNLEMTVPRESVRTVVAVLDGLKKTYLGASQSQTDFAQY